MFFRHLCISVPAYFSYTNSSSHYLLRNISDDKKCLVSGQQQLLPYRDRSGRRIYVALDNMGTNFSPESRVSAEDDLCIFSTDRSLVRSNLGSSD